MQALDPHPAEALDRESLTEAIPPVYTEYLGRCWLEQRKA